MKTKWLGSDLDLDLTRKSRAEIVLLRACKTAAKKGGAGAESAQQSERLKEVSSSSSLESKYYYLRNYASSVILISLSLSAPAY